MKGNRRLRTPSLRAAVGFAALALLVVGPAALAAYPPAGSSEACDSVSQTTVVSGQTITVSGTAPSGSKCFDDASAIEVHFRQSDHIIATTTADSSGNYHASGNVPSTVHAGPASVQVRGTLNGDPQSYSTAVTVGSGSSSPTNLPKTGQDIALMTLWGVVLLAIGIFLVRIARRRKLRRAT